MPPSPSPLEFFLDRALGRHVVAGALRDAGMTVHTMGDVYGDREQFVADPEWLTNAGREGWVVLTKDKRIRKRPSEIEAIGSHHVRAFVLARGNLTGSGQAACFIENVERIEQACSQPGPFVYAVYTRQIRKLWP